MTDKLPDNIWIDAIGNWFYKNHRNNDTKYTRTAHIIEIIDGMKICASGNNLYVRSRRAGYNEALDELKKRLEKNNEINT